MFLGCTGEEVLYKAKALTCQQSVTEVVLFPSVGSVVAMATLRGKSQKLNCQLSWRRQREAVTLAALLQQTQLVVVLCWTPFINMLLVSGQRCWLKGTSNPEGEEPCASRWRCMIISSWEIRKCSGGNANQLVLHAKKTQDESMGVYVVNHS